MAATQGGTDQGLVDLVADAPHAAAIQSASRAWPSLDLTRRQTCDLELLVNGAFSPLRGFLTRRDYEMVCDGDGMRLADGTLWPLPITLDVSEALAARLRPGAHLALRDTAGVMLAAMRVDDIWWPDLAAEAERVFGTGSDEHPGVAHLLRHSQRVYVGGSVDGLRLPTRDDSAVLRHTPRQLRAEFARRGWSRVVAFQTRNPIHRAHFELTLRAAEETRANLLRHPAVGRTSPGDIDHVTRVRAYEAVLRRYPAGSAMLSLLPLAMRMGGAARGTPPRHRPQKLRLHALHRRTRSRRPWLQQPGNAHYGGLARAAR